MDSSEESFEAPQNREGKVKREDQSNEKEEQNVNKGNQFAIFTTSKATKKEVPPIRISQFDKYREISEPNNKKDPIIKQEKLENESEEKEPSAHQVKVEYSSNPNPKKKLQFDKGINDCEYKKKVYIEGYGNVHFHKSFTPYPIQEKFIKHVLKAITEGDNALLESPTGTGKTLCLLSSTLSWLSERKNLNKEKNKNEKIQIIYLSRTHSQLTQVQKEIEKTDFEPTIAIFGSRDHLCVHEALDKVYGEQKTQECYAAVRRQKKPKEEDDDIENKEAKQQIVCSLKQNLIDNSKEIKEMFMNRQYDLEELRKEAKGNFCPFYFTELMKSDADIVFMPYNYLLNEDLVDKYSDMILNNVIIFDEAHNVPSAACSGKEFKICKYEINEFRKEFNKFFAHEKTKEINTLSKEFKHEITVVDSYLTRVEYYFNQFTEERQQRLEKEGEEIEKEIKKEQNKEIKKELINQVKKLKAKESVVIKEDKLVEFLGICFGNNEKWQKEAFDQLILAFNSTWDLNAKFLRIFYTFIQKLNKLWLNYEEQSNLAERQWKDIDLNHFRLIIETDYLEKYKMFTYTAKMVCLSPHLAFRTIQQLNPKSIIITSGTLSKVSYWEEELVVPIKEEPLINDAIAHQDQAPLTIITNGPKGQMLNFTFREREKENMWQDFFGTLCYLIDQIPNGVIVLFSSSVVMGIFMNFIKTKNPSYFEILNQKKEIFWERKKEKPIGDHENSDSEEDNLNQRGEIKKNKEDSMNEELKKYKEKAKTRKGAMLFCYCRGNFSEGLDFANEECRAVIAVGIPKGHWKDQGIQEKISYLKGIKKSKNEEEKKKFQDGLEWYNISAMRAVNQGIGRVIRHKFDYGRIFLIGQDFTDEKKNLPFLSEWAKRNMKIARSFGELQNMRIRESYAEMERKTAKDKEKERMSEL